MPNTVEEILNMYYADLLWTPCAKGTNACHCIDLCEIAFLAKAVGEPDCEVYIHAADRNVAYQWADTNPWSAVSVAQPPVNFSAPYSLCEYRHEVSYPRLLSLDSYKDIASKSSIYGNAATFIRHSYPTAYYASLIYSFNQSVEDRPENYDKERAYLYCCSSDIFFEMMYNNLWQALCMCGSGQFKEARHRMAALLVTVVSALNDCSNKKATVINDIVSKFPKTPGDETNTTLYKTFYSMVEDFFWGLRRALGTSEKPDKVNLIASLSKLIETLRNWAKWLRTKDRSKHANDELDNAISILEQFFIIDTGDTQEDVHLLRDFFRKKQDGADITQLMSDVQAACDDRWHLAA